ncbi:VTC domain-containing protein [Radiomyces spectabilis]|uniref:VTC domain-containing protein n=1 Tax=Radiomyces spectabilis TaxID=64574 RepID=UPI00221FB8F0|nr:VTC domain-containing protein [Radiomyces spectabilis]KAI8377891.1 VTC domain-containing protein [Radiomyces spectabilis]
MKFGNHLEQNVFAPWKTDYLQYNTIKYELKRRQLDHAWNAQDEAYFSQTVVNELERVDAFITRKMQQLDSRIGYCEHMLQSIARNEYNSNTQDLCRTLDESLVEVLYDVNDLAKFTRLNYIGFQKLLKKHDKWTDLNLRQTMVPQFQERALDNQRFDTLFMRLSQLRDWCRLGGQQTEMRRPLSSDVEAHAFQRSTTKYWVHPDNVTEVKAILLFNLPVLRYDPVKNYETSDSAVSSVYLDSRTFDLYTSRLQRDEGAEAIRLRWYGRTTSPHIFVERKTHHAVWHDGTSVKDRFRLQETEVQPFLKGTITPQTITGELEKKNARPNVINGTEFTAAGVQTSIQSKQLQPTLRVFYNRTAFQVPEDPRLRVSLDTELAWVREDDLDGKQRRQVNEWRRQDCGIDYPFSGIAKEDVHLFPYAVLETKLQTHLGQEPPEWLTRLTTSHLVHEVPHFSKYLHGASQFYFDQLPLLPWWLSELKVDIRKPRDINVGLSRSESLRPLMNGRYSFLPPMTTTANTTPATVSITASPSSAEATQPATPTKTMLSTTTTAVASSAHSPATIINIPHLELFKPTSEFQLPSDVAKRDSGLICASLWGRDLFSDASLNAAKTQSMLDSLSQHQTSPRRRVTLLRNGLAATLDRVKPLRQSFYLDNHDTMADEEEESPKSGTPNANPPWRWWRRRNASNGAGKANDEKNNNKQKVKIEPKVFFANERTFISWLQFCALLLTISLSLVNFGDEVSRICGGFFMVIAAVLSLYALWRYQYRAWQIRNKSQSRYDDLWGPAVLCLLLVIALIVNFVLRFRQPPPKFATPFPAPISSDLNK